MLPPRVTQAVKILMAAYQKVIHRLNMISRQPKKQSDFRTNAVYLLINNNLLGHRDT